MTHLSQVDGLCAAGRAVQEQLGSDAKIGSRAQQVAGRLQEVPGGVGDGSSLDRLLLAVSAIV